MYTLPRARRKPMRPAAADLRGGTGVAGGGEERARLSSCVSTDGMRYDDPSRRMNLLSGLVFGAILGAGLVLLLSPDERTLVRAPREAVRAARRVRGARGAEPGTPVRRGARLRRFEL